MKYTYDSFSWNENNNGKTSGKGGTNFKKIHKLFKNFVKHYPLRTHMVLRKPDNKLMDFYHPYSSEL